MKKLLLWIIAFIITAAAAIYQRQTGPTYPKDATVVLNSKEYEIELVRSLSLDQPLEVSLAISDPSVRANLYYKRLGVNEEYQVVEFSFRNEPGKEEYFANVPPQPAAGKIQYYIEITDNSGTQTLFKEEPVVIRFKGGVPAWVLIPHIILMFFAMLLSNLAGIMAIIKFPQYKRYAILTFIFLVIGGMILGPVVQYYAFGEFWTGVPFGWDLTDNKTLIAVIFWLIAVVANRKADRPGLIILASVVLLLVYSIPHSLFGSELDYTTGEVIQG